MFCQRCKASGTVLPLSRLGKAIVSHAQSRVSPTNDGKGSNSRWAQKIMKVINSTDGKVPIVVMGGASHGKPLTSILKEYGHSVEPVTVLKNTRISTLANGILFIVKLKQCVAKTQTDDEKMREEEKSRSVRKANKCRKRDSRRPHGPHSRYERTYQAMTPSKGTFGIKTGYDPSGRYYKGSARSRSRRKPQR